ncbi:MAG: hypothetical protein AB7O44_05690 [Hyphomicrobiaceae bacterium]
MRQAATGAATGDGRPARLDWRGRTQGRQNVDRRALWPALSGVGGRHEAALSPVRRNLDRSSFPEVCRSCRHDV